ncbi:MAG: twin-arginine translocase subunit TatC [Lachnospiraceae bacterium]
MARKKKNKNADSQGGNMSLTGHLKELRNRVVVSLVVLIAGMIFCFSYAERVVTMLTDIGVQFGYEFVYIRPQELLLVYFSISLIGALVIALPVIAYEIFAFCGPGLKKREQVFLLLAMIFGTIFFGLGVLFVYKIMMPFMLRFLISFSHQVIVSASISIQEYMTFMMSVFLIFGVIFELPVLSVILTGLGLIKPVWLIKARKVMIVVIFFMAAIFTPPDIVSQIMVAIPIILLYELSIILSRICYRFRRKEKEKAEAEDESDEDEAEDDAD